MMIKIWILNRFQHLGHKVLPSEEPQNGNGSLQYVDFILIELMSWIFIFANTHWCGSAYPWPCQRVYEPLQDHTAIFGFLHIFNLVHTLCFKAKSWFITLEGWFNETLSYGQNYNHFIMICYILPIKTKMTFGFLDILEAIWCRDK